MRRRAGLGLALFTLLIVLSSCGAAALDSPLIPPAETTTPTATPSPPPRDAVPPAESTPAAMSAPTEPALDANADPHETSAQAIAAQALAVETTDVLVMEIVAVNWSDSSLGCPQPGYLYAQAITPGYKATVEIEGETYFVHMDASGYGVLCQEEP